MLQETYELLRDDRGDHDAVKHELGDFLFEAVFLAQICEEEGPLFDRPFDRLDLPKS